MNLIGIGYWASESDDRWPRVESFVDPSWDPREREDVVSHLRSSMWARGFMGYSICRVCGELNGTCEFTDGTFLWPEGLAHYVEVHGVRLPDRFVQHARAMRNTLDDAEVNNEWWAQHDSPNPHDLDGSAVDAGLDDIAVLCDRVQIKQDESADPA